MKHFIIISEVIVCFSVKWKDLFFLRFEIANFEKKIDKISQLKCSNLKFFYYFYNDKFFFLENLLLVKCVLHFEKQTAL